MERGALKTSELPEILIVDDEPTNLNALEAMLEGTDCKPVRAHSADEALLLLLEHDFAAIVLDIKMPGIGGIELATLIKQRKRSQHIPILFLTAYLIDQPDILRGYGAGAVDFLSKPIDAGILRSKIGVFVELYRKSQTLRELNEVLHREIADRQQAQEALQHANEELEQRVQERTAELTRAHQGVRENEERLRMAMEVARIGAWEWHLASGRMTWSTDPEALFGFPPGSFGPELRPTRMLHPDDRRALDQAVTTALESGVYEVEYRSVRPDGSIVWLTERGRAVADSAGKPERMVGITRDVTAEREAEQERERLLREAREARDEAQRASRAKDEFLAMLSHELRNPLNVIAGGVAILDRLGPPDNSAAQTRQLIGRQLRHLTHLMDDLLDIARATTGKMVLHRQPIDLGATVEGCLTTLKEAGILTRHLFRHTIESVWVDADETRIQQIVTNLIGNAVKFTPAGGEVRVSVSGDGLDALLRVADTGPGIAPELLPHIFEPFVQGERTLDRALGGLGLGLSLVRRLTELHGGTVTVSSEGIGRGASFTIRLPQIAPCAKTIPIVSASASAPAPRRILVVEDNADGREILRRLLKMQGHEVHEAADGETAIERALTLEPDVAIIDIGLPGIDGYGVAAGIRASERGRRRMRLIALTGYGSEEDRRRAAEAGFDAHLLKPIDPKRLVQLLSLEEIANAQKK